jgi:hypothetical protein
MIKKEVTRANHAVSACTRLCSTRFTQINPADPHNMMPVCWVRHKGDTWWVRRKAPLPSLHTQQTAIKGKGGSYKSKVMTILVTVVPVAVLGISHGLSHFI